MSRCSRVRCASAPVVLVADTGSLTCVDACYPAVELTFTEAVASVTHISNELTAKFALRVLHLILDVQVF